MNVTKRDDGLFIIEMWSKRPPTIEELVSAGASIVSYDRPACAFTGESGESVRASKSPMMQGITVKEDQISKLYVSRSMIPTYDNTRAKASVNRKRYNARKLPLDACMWASQAYIMKVWYNGERVRIGMLLRGRDTHTLYAFDVYGQPMAILKARKRVKPAWIAEQLSMTVEPDIECLQLDALRKKTDARKIHHGERHIASNGLKRPKVG